MVAKRISYKLAIFVCLVFSAIAALFCGGINAAGGAATVKAEATAEEEIIEDEEEVLVPIKDYAFRNAVCDLLGIPRGSYIYDYDVADMETLSIPSKGITNLAGIEYFTGLKTLNCASNSLVSLDVSYNTQLTRLECNNNKIRTLTMNNNFALTYLNCNYNMLLTLDISHTSVAISGSTFVYYYNYFKAGTITGYSKEIGLQNAWYSLSGITLTTQAYGYTLPAYQSFFIFNDAKVDQYFTVGLNNTDYFELESTTVHCVGEANGEIRVRPKTGLAVKSQYVAYLVVNGNQSNSPVIFTVSKASGSGSVSVVPEWVYGSSEPPQTLVESATNGTDNVTYRYKKEGAAYFSDTLPSSVGTFIVQATFAATENYAVCYAEASFTVTPATITARATNASKTYDRNSSFYGTIVFDGLVGSDYVSTSNASYADANAGTNISISYTAGGNAANYIIIGTPVGEITPKEATLIVPNNYSKTYGAGDPVFGYTPSGFYSGYTPDVVGMPREPGESVGTYAVTAILGSNPNYTISITEGKLTITKKTLSLSGISSKEYDKTTALTGGFNVSGVISGDDVLIACEFPDAEIGTNKKLTVTISGADGGNYQFTTTYYASIRARVVTISASSVSKLVNAPDPEFSYYIINGSLLEGDVLNLMYERSAGEAAGRTYALSITLGSNPYYDVRQSYYGNLTILKALLTVSGFEPAKVYDGSFNVSGTLVLSGILDGDTVTVSCQYTSRNVGDAIELRFTLGGKDASNYTLTGYYTAAITPRYITVKASDRSKIYGEDDPLFWYTVTVGSFPTGGLSASYYREQGENVGSYKIFITPDYDPNYVITVEYGYLTITPRHINISAEVKTKVYGDPDPELTYRFTGIGLAFDDTLTINLSREQGEDVIYSGVGYMISLEVVGTYSNYTITMSGNAYLAITRRPLTVTADDITKEYGDADPVFTYKITSGNLVIGDALDLTLSRWSGGELGGYEIRITLGNNLNYDITVVSGTLTIGKRQITISPDNLTKVYGNADPKLTFSVTAGSVMYWDTLDLTVTRTDGENVGDYTVTITLGGNNPHYAIAISGEGVFTITKRPVTVTSTMTKTYGTDEPTLVYRLTSGSLAFSDGLNLTLKRAAGETVGNYAVTITLGSNPNYDITTVNGVFTIEKAQLTVTGYDASKVYDGTDSVTGALALVGVVGGDDVTVSGRYETHRAYDNLLVYFTLGGADSGNYEIIGTYKADIAPRPVTVTATATRVYGSADAAILTYIILEGSVVAGETLGINVFIPQRIDAGVYSMTVMEGGNYNYIVTVVQGTFTIYPRSITMRADDKSKVYGDADSGSYTVTYSEHVYPELNYSITRKAGENAGQYVLTIHLGDNPNYDITTENGVFTIQKRTVTIKAYDKTTEYAELYKELDWYRVSGYILQGDSLSLGLAKESGDDAGKYAIIIHLGYNPNYEITTVNGVYTVTPRSIFIQIDNASKTYGDSDDGIFTYKIVSGRLVGNDKLSLTFSRAAGENIGDYVISIASQNNPNYNVVAGNNSLFIITKRDITVRADNKTKQYGDTDPIFTATVTNLVNNDTLNLTLARVAGEAKTNYTITITLGLNPNYNITKVDGYLQITMRKITVTADDKTKVYGDYDPKFTYRITEGSLISGDTLDILLARQIGEDVGEYIIATYDGTNLNYDITVVFGMLTIIKNSITIATLNANKNYGEADPEIFVVIQSLYRLAPLCYTVARETTENVGQHTLYIILGENPNYDITIYEGVLTIRPAYLYVTGYYPTKEYDGTFDLSLYGEFELVGKLDGDDVTVAGKYLDKNAGYDISLEFVLSGEDAGNYVLVGDYKADIIQRSVTIIINDTSKTYGEDNPSFTYDSTNLLNGDTLTGAAVTVATQFSDATTYAITAGTLANSNYIITFVDGTLTVNPKAITITLNDASKTYGDNNPSFTYDSTNLLNGDTLTGAAATAATQFSNSGTYEITAGTLANSNYDITFIIGILTIHKATGSGNVSINNWIIGQTASSPMSDSSTNGTDNVIYEYKVKGADDSTYTSEKPTSAGEYTVKATFGATTNYDSYIATADFTITSSNLDNHGLSGGAIAGIVVVGVSAVALGGFAILWFIIKKKRFTDLLSVFKKREK